MGWRFSFKDTNIVAYLTSTERVPVPRVDVSELSLFLDELAHVPPSILISSDETWIKRIKLAASEAWSNLEAVENKNPNSSILDPDTIEHILIKLKLLFSDHLFFGLPIGGWEHGAELNAFVEYAAISSREHGLFLMPVKRNPKDGFSFLDPFPAVALLAEQSTHYPGVLFWSKHGVAAFAPLRDANSLYLRLVEAAPNIKNIDGLLEHYRLQNEPKKILHLSDLHFGTRWAAENEAYLEAHLDSVARSVSRVIVTGDLFDNPKRRDAIAFRNFRASLSRLTGKDVIVIPGNHDQKLLGNSILRFFGRSLRELANLEWSNLVIDDDIRCVFFCFDSSRDADFARGRVTIQQMMEVATLYETKHVSHPALRNYLHIALIHHHPFSFEAAQETIIQRTLQYIGLTDEHFLSMDDAENFLLWCAKRNIRLILHGHKHIPRHVSKSFVLENEDRRKVTAVGCGASLGAEGTPLSYNILTWDAFSNRWAVTFFADPGDGSGFTRQYIALHSVE